MSLPFAKSKADYWPSDPAGSYTCPTAPSVNLTGNAGDYAKYCILENEKNAQDYCKADPKCIGYAAKGNNFFQLSQLPPTKNPEAKGTFYFK